jgi:hypothetical protein
LRNDEMVADVENRKKGERGGKEKEKEKEKRRKTWGVG